MAETLNARLLVLGGGPGGYVAALRAAQLGLDVVLVEGDRLGGTCLIRGCIPSKSFIHAAERFADMVRAAAPEGDHGLRLAAPPILDLAGVTRWKDGVVDKLNGGVKGLLKRAGVRVVEGWGVFEDAKTCRVGDLRIRAEAVILAAGSTAQTLPGLPFGGPVVSSTEALDFTDLPSRLVVVGAGYIGLELGMAFRKFGADVEVVEVADRILPQYDAALTQPVAAALKRLGVRLRLSSRAKAFDGGALLVDGPEGEARLPADRVLVTVGRRPNTEGWGLETMGVDMDGRFVRVNDRLQTSMAGVWAVGDLVGEPMLEHKAAAQGHAAAEAVAGKTHRFDPASVAAVCFTDPEIATAGLSPDALGDDALVGIFPYQANGRALSMEAGQDGGFVRVVARRSTHEVVGIQAVGRGVSELSAEFALALEMGAVLEDLAGTIHVHPTLSEAVHEAALRALGQAIHI